MLSRSCDTIGTRASVPFLPDGADTDMPSESPILSTEFAPFLIEPRFVARIWGYRDLRPWYDFLAGDEPIGEVWLTGDDCRIASGAHAGGTLGQLFEQAPAELMGPAVPSGSPLLLKMIFAKEKLSVQVHPDDAMAQKYGQPRGKNRVLVCAGRRAGCGGGRGAQTRCDDGRDSRRHS